MTIIEFPAHEDADENGLLALGGDLELASLLLAYSNGIFPWPLSEKTLAWFSPPERTLLFLEEATIPKSLLKVERKAKVDIRIDHDFDSVIEECARVVNRGDQSSTWIHSAMQKAYKEFHRAGYAHSIECYRGEELIGGLYGVSLGKMFAGESMFFRESNASKLCLAKLIRFLRAQEVPWIDCQMMTPTLDLFGARSIARAEYLALLKTALEGPSISWETE